MAQSQPRPELVVATMHDLDLVVRGAEPRHLTAPKTASGDIDTSRTVRAAEDRTLLSLLHINIGPNVVAKVPVYEVLYRGLQNPGPTERLVGGLAANQFIVGSRIAGRALLAAGLAADRFGHPAGIIRDPETHRPVAASYIGVPRHTEYKGGDLDPLDVNLPRGGVYNLISLFPENLRLQLMGGRALELPRPDKPADVKYRRKQIGKTTDGVAVAHNWPTDVLNLPPGNNPNDLFLVHSEVLIEALRLGAVSPKDARRFVIATGVQRDQTNQQTSTFTGLAVLSTRTLRQFYDLGI